VAEFEMYLRQTSCYKLDDTKKAFKLFNSLIIK